MLELKLNVSQFIRDIKKWQYNFHFVAGKRLGERVMEAYERLVNETPQWSGTTAASWAIGFGRGVPGGFVDLRDQTPPRGKAPIKYKAHGAAVGIGLSRADQSLVTTNLEAYKTQDIVVVNDSPNFDIAENGPLRDINMPGGMFAAFQEELDSIVINLDAEISG